MPVMGAGKYTLLPNNLSQIAEIGWIHRALRRRSRQGGVGGSFLASSRVAAVVAQAVPVKLALQPAPLENEVQPELDQARASRFASCVGKPETGIAGSSDSVSVEAHMGGLKLNS